MPLVVKDRVRETSTTSGTGALILGGASAGFQSFSVIGNNNTTYYAIVDPAIGAWEVGVGTYNTVGPTLTRDTVLESSNNNNLVTFSAGVKDVFCTYPAEQAVTLDDVQTLTNKTISGSSNTLTNIGNSSLTNSSITFGSTAQALGSTVSAFNGVSVGATTASTGAFTTLSYTGTLTGGTGVVNLGSGQFYKDASGNVGIGTTNTNTPGVSILRSFNLSWEQSATESIPNIFRQSSSADLIIGSGVRYTGTVNGFASSYASPWARSAVSVGYGAIKFLTAAEATVAVGTDTTLTERMRIDSTGNLLMTNSTGALGYGAGSGGTVTQATSKSTTVTLNRASGKITMNNAALAATTTVTFILNNSLLTSSDVLAFTFDRGAPNASSYNVWAAVDAGSADIHVRNISGGSLSDAVRINFAIIKGSTS